MTDFATTYERHAAHVLACCRRWAGDDGDDLAQQTWLEAYERWPSYEDRGYPVTAWLLRIARSRHIDALRRARRRPLVALDSQRGAHDPALAAVEAYADIGAAVARARLTPVQRRALGLVAAGWRPREAARRLGWTEGALKAALFRARRAVLE